jgi:tRNA(Ile)-lysidine synthase
LSAVKTLNILVYELFKRFGFSAAQVEGIINLMSASTGKFICSDTHRVLKNRDWLLIHPLIQASQQMLVIDHPGVRHPLNGRDLSISIIEKFQDPETASSQAWLDADKVSFPLLIRPMKTGDYFYPLGMRKKKKIARFLTDLKKSRQEKELQWVVESEKKILWIIGLRIDDRFKITSKTKKVLLLKWE